MFNPNEFQLTFPSLDELNTSTVRDSDNDAIMNSKRTFPEQQQSF